MEFYIAKVANYLLEPLHILSYGGTAMLTNMIGFGIVLSAKLYNEDFI